MLERGRLGEVGRLFLRLGLTTFGGPAAHIAVLRDEVVRRRGWLTDVEFLQLLAASNLVPGPTSTELAFHVGHRRAGWPGFAVAGTAFILPSVAIVGCLAWAYVTFGARPETEAVLAGVTPVVVVILVRAGASLARATIRSPAFALVAIGAAGAILAGVGELATLVAGAAAGIVIGATTDGSPPAPTEAPPDDEAPPSEEPHDEAPPLEGPQRRLGGAAGLLGLGGLARAAAPMTAGAAAGLVLTPATLFLAMLKVGAIIYGSGYVLVAFLHADLVVANGWLTDRQLLDAVAAGQLTPGPLFSTATFVGYLLLGPVGAIVATVAMFLPAVAFVALSVPLLPRLLRARRGRALVEGVSAASLGLLAAVVVGLGRETLAGPFPVIVALSAGAALLVRRGRLGSGWLVLAGAVAGLLRLALGLAGGVPGT
jgi:chromate transporter